MRWAIGVSLILHLLLLTLVFRGATVKQKSYPPVMMVRLSAPPISKGIPNPAVEKSTPQQAKQTRKIEPPKEETRVAEVNKGKRPQKPKPKPTPSAPKEESMQDDTREIKSKGLPEGVDLGSEFGSARLDASGFDSPYYLNILFSKIRNEWDNPFDGAESISCIIYFVVSRDGKIIDSAIEKSSGVTVYDQAALRAVLNVKAPPLPNQFDANELGIHLEFQYLPGI